jgi:hypothetical protein
MICESDWLLPFLSSVELDEGSMVNRSFVEEYGVRFWLLFVVFWYKGDSDLEVSNCCDLADTEETKFSVLDLEA